ncbi:MAG: methyl-accepting chemotaxis protein [Thermodesulfobacteriota bacterium]|nr:methyl-accepting chemotaxis protein [Thermodesulfobacteriota bacterium]
MEKPKYKRKVFNFSIKKKMQLRLLLKVFLIVLISVVICTTIFYFYSNRVVGTSYRLFHVKAENFLDFLLPAVILSFVLSTIAGFIISLFFPNPIAGPLYRIEKEILRIADGDLTSNIIIRKGDEMKDLADAINIMMKGLRKRIEEIKLTTTELRNLRIQTENEKLKEISQMLEEKVNSFTL